MKGVLIAALLAAGLTVRPAAGSVVINPGTVDTSFNTTNGPFISLPGMSPSIVWTVRPLRNGQVLVGGAFAQVGGTNVPYLARLNSDGTLDPTFLARPSDVVRVIVEQPDGRILIGGDFNRVNDQFRDRVARLEADGTLDTNYLVRLGMNGSVRSLALQPEGKVMVGGILTVIREEKPALYNVLRLEPSGQIDDSFAIGSQLRVTDVGTHFVEAVAVQPDGKVLAAGTFTRSAGAVRDYLARFHPDGSHDRGFYSAYPFSANNGAIRALSVTAEGLILLGYGNFDRPYAAVSRLLPSGRLDESFVSPEFNYPCHVAAEDSGGRTWVISSLLLLNSHYDQSRLYRLDALGRLDTNFAVGFGNYIRPSESGLACLALTDGDVAYVGGSFNAMPTTPTAYFNSRRVARLHSDPALPPRFTVQPAGLRTDVGREALLTASVVGGFPMTCQWWKNGEALPGRTNTALYFADVHPEDAGTYQLIVSNRLGVLASEMATIVTRGPIVPGGVDLAFAPNWGTDGEVFALANALNGGLYLGGQFTNYESEIVVAVARANPDGSLDRGFRSPYYNNGRYSASVRSLCQHPNGMLLAAGNSVVAMRDDGTSFQPFGDANYQITGAFRATALYSQYLYWSIQNDARGRILLGGSIGSFDGDPAKRSLVRLHPDGTLDNTFSVGSSSRLSVTTTTLMDDGRILAGGVSIGSDRDAVLLGERGGTDPTFMFNSRHVCPPISGGTGTIDCGSVAAIVTEPDGGLILGGNFTSVGVPFCGFCYHSQNYLCRFTSGGLIDSNFVAQGVSGPVNALLRQPDGRLLLGGDFTSVNGVPRHRLARLLPDGTVDPSFDVGEGPNGPVNAMLLRPDGKIAVGGRFTRFNGHYRGSIALIHPDFWSAPAVIGNPAQLDSTVGRALKLAPLISGYPTPTVQWLLNGQRINAANGPVLALESLRPWDAGTYSLILSNALGVVTNVIAQLTLEPQLIQADAVDATFFAGSGPDDDVSAIAVLPDGRILIGGRFRHVNGVRRVGLARLHPDGSIDDTFDVGEGLAGLPAVGVDLSSIALQPDGRILVAGSFNTFGGAARAGLARLNEDGSVDSSFNVTSIVNRVAVQSDGRILVSGTFTQIGGVYRTNLARLFPNGTVDPTFAPALSMSISLMAPAADGSILIVGMASESSSPLAQLRSDGSVKWQFLPGGTFAYPSTEVCFPVISGGSSRPFLMGATVRPDGGIVVGGVFSWDTVGGVRHRLLGFDSFGQFDATFGNPGLLDAGGPNAAVRVVLSQSDGALLIGGCFTNVQGTLRRALARLRPNGLLDPAFDPDVRLSGDLGFVKTIAVQSDGRILVGGRFNQVDGLRRNNLARLGGELMLYHPVVVGDSFTARISTVAGRRYYLESRISLDEGVWQVVHETTGDGTTRVLTDVVSPESDQRYYRIRAE